MSHQRGGYNQRLKRYRGYRGRGGRRRYRGNYTQNEYLQHIYQDTGDRKHYQRENHDQETKKEKLQWKKKQKRTKAYYREKVWNYMEYNNIALFPRPVYHRIPNFIGSDVAAQQILKIPEFIKSTIVKVNPDRPQTHVRYLCLKMNKRLFVPPAALKQNGILTEIIIPHHLKKDEKTLKYAATRKGFEHYGQLFRLKDLISWNKKEKIDVVVIGSVAIDRQTGYRIGKGEGFADMEIAIMNHFGLIDKNTTFIVTMHDCQIQDGIDMTLFDRNTDVKLDYICTPTQIIKIKNDYQDDSKNEMDDCLPYKINWDKLSEKRINKIPFLRTLYNYQHRDKAVDMNKVNRW